MDFNNIFLAIGLLITAWSLFVVSKRKGSFVDYVLRLLVMITLVAIGITYFTIGTIPEDWFADHKNIWIFLGCIVYLIYRRKGSKPKEKTEEESGNTIGVTIGFLTTLLMLFWLWQFDL